MAVNGEAVELLIETNRLLVDVLRDELQLTGTKTDCGMGVCGTCTVLVDGRPVSSCLMLACLADGRDVLTIEGLSAGDRLDPIQDAFAEVGAFECGFCTTGMIMSARALLNDHPTPGREEIVEFMAGNLCRCTGYANILRAIGLAAERERHRASEGTPAVPRARGCSSQTGSP